MIGVEARYVNVKNDCSATGVHGTTGVVWARVAHSPKGAALLERMGSMCLPPSIAPTISYACTPKRDFDDYKVKSKRVYVAHDFMLARYEKI